MSAPAAARGPLAFLLKSQSGQWMVISLGAIYAFPEQARQLLFPALKEASQWSDIAKQLSAGLGDGVEKAATTTTAVAPPTPIIIHTGGSSQGDNGVTGIIIKYSIMAGACWVGYIVLTQALPDAVQEVMPVTRKFFAKSSKVLAEGILQVKKVMETKIAMLSKKQDDMDAKLDNTHASVQNVQKDLDATRDDISKLGASMDRCEHTLISSKRLQAYTSKGVTLLVRCVAGMLPSNDRSVNELAQYIQDGEEIGKREQEQRRLADLKGAGAILSPEPPVTTKNYLIRDSELDSSLHSLEDVQSILGFGPGGLLKAL
jgi:hypothetical protein